MPSKRSSSPSDQSRAFGFSSNPRRDDPTHELIAHLLRGAAALAARHWMKKRKDKHKPSSDRSKANPNANPSPPAHRNTSPANPSPTQSRRHRPHRHRPDSHYPCARPTTPPKSELVLALDSLSAELGRTTGRIRQLAAEGRPHRHRDGRCDVSDGLRECAARLEGEVGRVREAGNNIRNLSGVVGSEGRGGERWERGEGMMRRKGDGVVGGTRAAGERRDGSYVRTRPTERAGSFVRRRPTESRAGSFVSRIPTESRAGGLVRSREAPQDRGSQGGGRKVRVRGEERGRKRTRSR